MKKTLCFVLAAVTVLLSSCGIIIINDGAETTAAVETDGFGTFPEILTATPIEDVPDGFEEAKKLLNGVTVSPGGGEMILVCADADFFTGGDDESQLNSDRYARIAEIEKKTGCSYHVREMGTAEIVKGVADSVKSGDLFADILAVPYFLIGSLVSQNLLTDLNTVPSFNKEAAYINKNSLRSFTIDGKLYAISGDGTFEPEKTDCLVYNDAMAQSLGADIGEAVEKGEWTLDKYNELLAASVEPAATVYGEGYEERFLLNSGMLYSEASADGLKVFTDEFSGVCGKLASAFSADKPGGENDFADGKALFTSCKVPDLREYRDTPFVWGTAPYPKVTADYSIVAASDATVLCIPAKVYSAERGGDYIECLNAMSSEYIRDRYISYQANYILRNEASVHALQIILSDCKYDITVALRSQYTALSDYTVKLYKKMLEGSVTADELADLKIRADEYLDRYSIK